MLFIVFTIIIFGVCVSCFGTSWIYELTIFITFGNISEIFPQIWITPFSWDLAAWMLCHWHFLMGHYHFIYAPFVSLCILLWIVSLCFQVHWYVLCFWLTVDLFHFRYFTSNFMWLLLYLLLFPSLYLYFLLPT